jgi:hypothetical protein
MFSRSLKVGMTTVAFTAVRPLLVVWSGGILAGFCASVNQIGEAGLLLAFQVIADVHG